MRIPFPVVAIVAGASVLALAGCTQAADPSTSSETSDNAFTLYSGRDEALIQPAGLADFQALQQLDQLCIGAGHKRR